MKTKEQVLERIEYTKQQILWAEESMNSALTEVKEKMSKHDPAYVSEWIEAWMGSVNSHNERIAELRKEILMLDWVLK